MVALSRYVPNWPERGDGEMGVVAWGDMAVQDLRDATSELAVRREFLDLAETELRYPPIRDADEGFLIEYDNRLAYRRALRRAAPSRSVDLATDPTGIDGGGFPFGHYYYVYHPPSRKEAREMGERGRVARLIVNRLLHDSQMVGQLPSQ
jgi:hypothetical protein